MVMTMFNADVAGDGNMRALYKFGFFFFLGKGEYGIHHMDGATEEVEVKTYVQRVGGGGCLHREIRQRCGRRWQRVHVDSLENNKTPVSTVAALLVSTLP